MNKGGRIHSSSLHDFYTDICFRIRVIRSRRQKGNSHKDLVVACCRRRCAKDKMIGAILAVPGEFDVEPGTTLDDLPVIVPGSSSRSRLTKILQLFHEQLS